MREIVPLVDQIADPEKGAAARVTLRAEFARWKADVDGLSGSGGQEPRLQEIAPLLESLHDLADAGLSALDFLDLATAPPSNWRAAQEPILARAEQPAAEMHSLLVPVVRQILDTAAAVHSPSTRETAAHLDQVGTGAR
jgi:hypothetical protein